MTRDAFLPFASPDIGPEEIDAVREVLESGWITTGPHTALFEVEFRTYVGASFALAVNSWPPSTWHSRPRGSARATR
jgi:dTDP-4-amino-4,6-dideoxygalactose transaminase